MFPKSRYGVILNSNFALKYQLKRHKIDCIVIFQDIDKRGILKRLCQKKGQ